MTTPREEQPQESVPATPAVSTAPPRARWRFGNVPSHVGPARTSTVVLAVLFVGLFTLWLFVRPPDPAQQPTAGTPAATTTAPVPQQAPPATEAPTTQPPTTEAPATTTEKTTPPEETAPPPTTPTSSEAPSSTGTTAATVSIPPTSATAPVS
ncbi:hypothetical protein [Geodermatophilus sp. URMC 64]